MGKHQTDLMTKARDELMSHTARCQVLDASQPDRVEWLEDTIEYMAGRYPGLTELQIAQLEAIGRQFIRPVIAHGAGYNAVTERRPAPTSDPAASSAAPDTSLEEAAEGPHADRMEVHREPVLAGSGAT